MCARMSSAAALVAAAPAPLTLLLLLKWGEVAEVGLPLTEAEPLEALRCFCCCCCAAAAGLPLSLPT